MTLIDAHIEAPGREEWRHGFAWVPTWLADGSLVWLIGIQWRYEFVGLFDSYRAPERPANERVYRRN